MNNNPSFSKTGKRQLLLPTWGGKQFWTDQFIHGRWRIQQHCFTGHHRLLDQKNFCHASGSYDKCREKFEWCRNRHSIPPLGEKAVVLMHGLGRTRSSMSRIAQRLEAEGFTTINVEYASTRAPIKTHAAALNRIINDLEGVQQVYFAGHSMGNIVWRYFLQHHTGPNQQIAGDKKIMASVMIAPPNHGAYVARFLRPTVLFGIVTGQSGKTLARADWSQFAESLATPRHQFAIIAGKFNGNPIFSVDNDTTVTVEETRLAGATDFLVVHSMHATIMNHPEVVQATARFFHHGCLVAEDQVNSLT